MSKIDDVKSFIGDGALVDLSIMKDRSYEVEMSHQYGVNAVIEGDKLVLVEMGRQGQLTEQGIDEVTDRTVKVSFIDEDKNRITIKLIKRNIIKQE